MNTLSDIKYNLFAAIKNQKKNQPNKYKKKTCVEKFILMKLKMGVRFLHRYMIQ